MRLNIGCGRDIREGYINLDYHMAEGVQIVHDLNKYPYPFKSNVFDEIIAYDIIEHIESPQHIMNELFRILKKGGTLRIKVPHHTNPDAYDCFHKSFWNVQCFDAFVINPRRNHISMESTNALFKLVKLQVTTHKGKLLHNYIIEPIANINPLLYENTFMAGLFPLAHIYVELRK